MSILPHSTRAFPFITLLFFGGCQTAPKPSESAGGKKHSDAAFKQTWKEVLIEDLNRGEKFPDGPNIDGYVFHSIPRRAGEIIQTHSPDQVLPFLVEQFDSTRQKSILREWVAVTALAHEGQWSNGECGSTQANGVTQTSKYCSFVEPIYGYVPLGDLPWPKAREEDTNEAWGKWMRAYQRKWKEQQLGVAFEDRNLYKPEVPRILYEWKNGKAVEAPAEDAVLAGTYHAFPDKGPKVKGIRITILTRKTRYMVNEPVRVVHVWEAVDPGITNVVMSFEPIQSEYVDGRAAAKKMPSACGRCRFGNSPLVDFRYDITTYAFNAPGEHTIQWKIEDSSPQRESNVIKLQVVRE